MHERTHNNRHHDETGHDEFHIGIAIDRRDLRSDKATEDNEIERHRDDRREQRLRPHSQVANGFLADDRSVSDPKFGWIHRELSFGGFLDKKLFKPIRLVSETLYFKSEAMQCQERFIERVFPSER